MQRGGPISLKLKRGQIICKECQEYIKLMHAETNQGFLSSFRLTHLEQNGGAWSLELN